MTDLAALVMDELELRLSARTAIADSQRRLDEVEQLARALQSSLLPPQLPDIPHLQIAAIYQPLDRHQVGGDFYDAFPIDERAWAIAIGDVCGTGPDAAARTSSARYSLRANAIQHHLPSDVLRYTNQALTRGDDTPGRFITAVMAHVEPHPDRAVVHLASAGHPLPLLLRANGQVHAVGQEGQLLGVLPDIQTADTTIELAAGDTLVLYTDGLTDSGRPDRLEDDGLRRLLAGCSDMTPAEVVNELHNAVVDAPRDDIAIVAISPNRADG